MLHSRLSHQTPTSLNLLFKDFKEPETKTLLTEASTPSTPETRSKQDLTSSKQPLLTLKTPRPDFESQKLDITCKEHLDKPLKPKKEKAESKTDFLTDSKEKSLSPETSKATYLFLSLIDGKTNLILTLT